MAKKRTPVLDPATVAEVFDPVNVGLLGYEDEEVELVLAGDGMTAAFLPTSIARLSGDRLEVVASLQRTVLAIQAAQERLSDEVHDARDLGVSWDVIGWCVGL